MHPPADGTTVPAGRADIPPPPKVLRRIRETRAGSWEVREKSAETPLPDFLLELP